MSTVKKMSVRERNKRQTREHLLMTAVELFSAQGFAATSIDDIVSAAGAGRATLYAHFPSKDALLAEIVQRMWNEASEHYVAFGQLEDWSRASILAWLRDFADHWALTVQRNKAAGEAAALSIVPELPRWRRDQVALIRHNAALWAHFTPQEARLRAALVVTSVQAQLEDYFFGRMEADLEVLIGNLADALRDLLRAP